MVSPTFPTAYGNGSMGQYLTMAPPSYARRLNHTCLSRIQPRKLRSSVYYQPGHFSFLSFLLCPVNLEIRMYEESLSFI